MVVASRLPDQDFSVATSQATLVGSPNQATPVGTLGWHGEHWATLPSYRKRRQLGRDAVENVSGPSGRTSTNSSHGIYGELVGMLRD